MKICGIIAEYNPFHNGHAYQIQKTRKHATHIVAVMSGHFTQRGDVACLSKWTRAEAALRSGVDLVLELPVTHACASAERFAQGAVSILHRLGCVDMLSFGSESGDLQALKNCAEKCMTIHRSEQMQKLLTQGYSYPKARQLALGEEGALLETPNNTLAVEYIKACHQQGAEFSFFTVRRKGAGHDSQQPGTQYASASFLRTSDDWSDWVPEEANRIYQACRERADFSRLHPALLYRLRTVDRDELLSLPDMTEGLENRFLTIGRSCCSVPEFLIQAKTKRYTMARLRRMLCFLLLGLNRENAQTLPPYIRILGFNQKGKEVLAKAKKTASLPLSPDFPKLFRMFPEQAALEVKATDLFALSCPSPMPGGADFYYKPVILD